LERWASCGDKGKLLKKTKKEGTTTIRGGKEKKCLRRRRLSEKRNWTPFWGEKTRGDDTVFAKKRKKALGGPTGKGGGNSNTAKGKGVVLKGKKETRIGVFCKRGQGRREFSFDVKWLLDDSPTEKRANLLEGKGRMTPKKR